MIFFPRANDAVILLARPHEVELVVNFFLGKKEFKCLLLICYVVGPLLKQIYLPRANELVGNKGIYMSTTQISDKCYSNNKN